MVSEKLTKHNLIFKNEKSRIQHENKRVELIDNFIKLNPTGTNLIPRNFTKISNISAHSYQKTFKMTWLEIIEEFGKREELFNILLDEFEKWNKVTGKSGLIYFCLYIGYNYSKLSEDDRNIFREKFEISNRKHFGLEELETNFKDLINEIGRVPLYKEFMEKSKIDIPVYTRKLELSGQNSVYDEIVNRYASKDEIEEYHLEKIKDKRQRGIDSMLGNYKYSDEELETEFKKVFDEVFENTGEYPPRRAFNKISKFDDSLYRKRLGKSFTEITEQYGYKLTDRAWKSEKIVLNSISGILKENYSPQHTFDWLLSIKSFPLFCDGYFKNSNLVIEFDGKQHDEPIEFFGGIESFKVLTANDAIKNTLIPQHGIKLLRIRYDEPYLDIDYLKFKLLSIGINIPNYTVINEQ